MRTISLRHLGALLSAAALAAGMSACGEKVLTSAFKGESHLVAQRLADFQNHAMTNDERKLCEQDLAKALQARMNSAGSCNSTIKAQLREIDTFQLSIQSIAVKADRATAQLKSTWSGRLRTSTVSLIKEGGAWRISALAASAS